MNNPRERPTARAQRELCAVLQPGDLAIDATAGNGYDTLFLARLVGEQGQVLAFDVQQAALDSTARKLVETGVRNVRLILASHATLPDYVSAGVVAGIMFNLGYLPGGDHTLITEEGSTLLALNHATAALRPGGLLTIVCYPGHPGGDRESAAVTVWARGLTAGWSVEVDRPADAPVTSPFLILVRRL